MDRSEWTILTYFRCEKSCHKLSLISLWYVQDVSNLCHLTLAQNQTTMIFTSATSDTVESLQGLTANFWVVFSLIGTGKLYTFFSPVRASTLFSVDFSIGGKTLACLKFWLSRLERTTVKAASFRYPSLSKRAQSACAGNSVYVRIVVDYLKGDVTSCNHLNLWITKNETSKRLKGVKISTVILPLGFCGRSREGFGGYPGSYLAVNNDINVVFQEKVIRSMENKRWYQEKWRAQV